MAVSSEAELGGERNKKKETEREGCARAVCHDSKDKGLVFERRSPSHPTNLADLADFS